MKCKTSLLLPEYPKTPHLPYKPNISDGDNITTEEIASVIFQKKSIVVEEKIDGANCAMTLVDGYPLIRNRTHILRKGYLKNTTAKKQFLPIWNWFYDHKKLFEKLKEYGNYSVYGEWMYAQHGINYDKLGSLFYAFALYDRTEWLFLDPLKTRTILTEVGFLMPPSISIGPVLSYEQLEKWTQEPSELSSNSKREGIYLKVGNGLYATHNFKMVRSDYIRGALWDNKILKKNHLMKGIKCQ